MRAKMRATAVMVAVPDRRRRPRWLVAVLLAATIALGLLSRRYPLPGILAEYTGDALYATAAYWGFALLAAAARAPILAVIAFVACLLVECSQMLSWPWLQDLRATSVGRLLLGSGFKWPDLVAYAVGVSVAATVDRIVPGGTSCDRNFCGGVAPDTPSDR